MASSSVPPTGDPEAAQVAQLREAIERESEILSRCSSYLRAKSPGLLKEHSTKYDVVALRDAFDLAKKSVLEGEDADKQEHSEPQIATSPSIEAKLADWRQRLVERPNVPFQPAAKSR